MIVYEVESAYKDGDEGGCGSHGLFVNKAKALEVMHKAALEEASDCGSLMKISDEHWVTKYHYFIVQERELIE